MDRYKILGHLACAGILGGLQVAGLIMRLRYGVRDLPADPRADTPDVVIVQINPPKAAEMMTRVNEISFNLSPMRRMRAVSFVTDLIDAGKLDSSNCKRVNVRWIEAEKQMRGLGVSSKPNARLDFLLHLKAIGRRSTIDIKEKFL